MDLRHRPVSEIMQREILTLSPKDTLAVTEDVIGFHGVRHVPVVDEGRLVGVLSNRDLLAASMTKALRFDKAARRSFVRSVEIGDVMTTDVVTIAPETTLADAAGFLVHRRIGCLPVVDGTGTLIGVVTETDLIAAAFLADEPRAEKGTDAAQHTGFSEWLEEELNDLRRMRDELRIQAHLGKAEMRDRWDALEGALETLEQHAKRVASAAERPLHRLETDVRKLARDLREAYRRIREPI